GGWVVVTHGLFDKVMEETRNERSVYDFVLQASEKVERVKHIARILSHRHWPDAASAECSRQEQHALEESLRRRRLQGAVTSIGNGYHSVRYAVESKKLVSILIPTRDKLALLQKCLTSIQFKTDYPNFEVIVLDNDSIEPATVEFLSDTNTSFRVIRCPGAFNFSSMNNIGVRESLGDYLVFLNNDIEVIAPDWITAMVEHAQRPEVGAVGARLLFSDRTIQHAGVVLGIGGITGHAFRFQKAHRSPPGLAEVV